MKTSEREKINIFSWRNFKMRCQGSVLKGERLWAILALREDDKRFFKLKF